MLPTSWPGFARGAAAASSSNGWSTRSPIRRGASERRLPVLAVLCRRLDALWRGRQSRARTCSSTAAELVTWSREPRARLCEASAARQLGSCANGSACSQSGLAVLLARHRLCGDWPVDRLAPVRTLLLIAGQAHRGARLSHAWCHISIFMGYASITTPFSARSGPRPRCASFARSRHAAQPGPRSPASAAAAAMLGKYWSIFLLAGLALAALVDARRAVFFRSHAPWITIAVGALLLAPHLAWLVAHDFHSAILCARRARHENIRLNRHHRAAAISPAAPATPRRPC